MLLRTTRAILGATVAAVLLPLLSVTSSVYASSLATTSGLRVTSSLVISTGATVGITVTSPIGGHCTLTITPRLASLPTIAQCPAGPRRLSVRLPTNTTGFSKIYTLRFTPPRGPTQRTTIAVRAASTPTTTTVPTTPTTIPSSTSVLSSTQVPSANWAGYEDLASDNGQFTSAGASWTVPSVSCAATPSGDLNYAVEWVGIGGVGNDTLAQDGTQQVCENGTPAYMAWVEMLGDHSFNNGNQQILDPAEYPVAAGDAIAVNVTLAGTTWDLSVTDTTAGWADVVPVPNYSPSPSLSSAEWVVERPTVCSPNCSPSNLVDFSSIAFTNAAVTYNNAPGSILTADPYAVVMTGANGNIATPGPLEADATAFMLAWDRSS